jgi:hypothetical protein
MARRFAVQHFLTCARATAATPAPGTPHTLHEVGYTRAVPADREWPVRLDGLAVYARFFNPRSIDEFTIQVVWLDAPEGRREVCEYRDLVVRGRDRHALGWVWGLSVTRFPGPGRYVLRLRRLGTRRVLARDYLEVTRAP